DWMHSNALDYNPELDQIMISVPTFHEIWIIDHSTTTQQASGSTGGNAGRGGDLLYRWGNPAAYDRGTEEDQTLFYQHDVHWVDDFVDNTHPYYGQIAVFNNRVGADFSTVNIWRSSWDMYKGDYLMDEGVFLPNSFNLSLTHPTPQEMYSTGLSSFQQLPNGNFLICTGRFGYSFELTPDSEVVWEYKTPLLGGQPVSQGDTLEINNNLTFRITRYPLDFAGFSGQTLDPQGYIELNPDSTYCSVVLSNSEIQDDFKLNVFPNPTSGSMTIEWEKPGMTYFVIYDLLGRRVKAFTGMGGRKFCDFSMLDPGMYLLEIEGQAIEKIILQK
ncbi:MAG: T9SS type A sorting domain-containing protein, partial [Saprospiraceae bacterium]|nr:T9SS type A sorting domain-containing protein [Saprospiraceae bacterium]